jgi:hypothetical protein
LFQKILKCRSPTCKQALHLLKIIRDTLWSFCLEKPVNSLWILSFTSCKKYVEFSHKICHSVFVTNNNHMDWTLEILEATICELFIACSNNTGPMILHTHCKVMWRNCVDVLDFLNTNICYIGCVFPCLMWTTAYLRKIQVSYFILLQYP